MQDDNQDIQNPQDNSTLLPVEQTPEVEEKLKEFGVDLDTEEKKEEVPQETETPANAQPLATEEKPVPPVDEKPEEEVEITEDQAQKLIEEQTGEKKKEDEVYPWEAENREPTQKEILDYVANKAVDIQEQRAAEAKKADEERATKEQEAQQQNLKNWKTKWEGDIDWLERTNRIPKVKDAKDPNDPGMMARRKLYEEAVKNQELDLRVVQLVHVDANKNNQPAGARAPITTPGAQLPETDDDDFFYDEIHNKNPDQDFNNVELEGNK